MTSAPSVTAKETAVQPEWKRRGFKNVCEMLMWDFLRMNGYADAEYEGDANRIVLAHYKDGTPRSWTVPDFTIQVSGQRVAVEVTVCSWKHHVSKKQASIHKRELRYKRTRAKRIRHLGYAYILVEKEWLHEILDGEPAAIDRFHWVARKEARRTRQMSARVQAHQKGEYRPRQRRPHRTRRQHRHRSLPLAA